MKLTRALRINAPTCIALVGAGGKTTAISVLANELPKPVIVTTSTHLHRDQRSLANSHIVIRGDDDTLDPLSSLSPITLITGPLVEDRFTGLDELSLKRLHSLSQQKGISLIIEADGSKRLPLKAPAEHEPVIPDFADLVVVVGGLSGIGKVLDEEHVHRPKIFSELSGLSMGENITAQALTRVLLHAKGGLKGIPSNARRVVLLNQVDAFELSTIAKGMVKSLLSSFHQVIIASLSPGSQGYPQTSNIQAVHESVAGIVLAAGSARRFGRPKQVLDWHGVPLLRHVSEVALSAGLSPVIVVLGYKSEEIETAIHDLPVNIRVNKEWESGQGSSIRSGCTALPVENGAAIFLLADQPGITAEVIQALVERHSETLDPVLAPWVNGQRANPVLFDRLAFADLSCLKGDKGGREIFSKYPPAYLSWHDPGLLEDIDTYDDYLQMLDDT